MLNKKIIILFFGGITFIISHNFSLAAVCCEATWKTEDGNVIKVEYIPFFDKDTCPSEIRSNMFQYFLPGEMNFITFRKVDMDICMALITLPPPPLNINSSGTNNTISDYNVTQTVPRIVLDIKYYFNFIKVYLLLALKCGRNADPILESKALGQIVHCFFDILNILKNFAMILLGASFVVAGGYYILSPIFGEEKIRLAKTIMIWSIIGLVIILAADIIKSQIERLTR